jgi:hypothetical protein
MDEPDVPAPITTASRPAHRTRRVNCMQQRSRRARFVP